MDDTFLKKIQCRGGQVRIPEHKNPRRFTQAASGKDRKELIIECQQAATIDPELHIRHGSSLESDTDNDTTWCEIGPETKEEWESHIAEELGEADVNGLSKAGHGRLENILRANPLGWRSTC